MKTRNSDRLKEILGAKRNQIVALKDIQMYLLETNPEVATKISYQIDREEEVYKNLLKVIELAEISEPKRNGWFSGHIKTREDRLANIMD
jgi:ribosomal protein L5